MGLQIGDNYGPIHADFHSERPETPPTPLSNVPFPRDPDFVRRDTLLDQIHERRTIPGSRVALVGLGGVGKSQLAIEYSYQVRSESPTTWVFWIHSSNEARFEQSFREIAEQLKLPNRREKVNIFQLVESWLRDERKGKWVCVLDNVDDNTLVSSPMTLETAAMKPLLHYIPRSPNGFTVITSRSKDVALRMVDDKDIVDVKPMNSSEALDLLQKRLGRSGDNPEVIDRQLVEALDFMPLAIIQAASYIKNRAPRCSVAQYLNDFQKSDREATKLLKKEVGHTHRDWEARNSILVTWQISFEHLREKRRSAANLLSIMSFFDRQGIPEILLQHQLKADDVSNSESKIVNGSDDGDASESDDSSCFEDDIATLRDFSFISVSENITSFTMHRLVQLSMRAWLKQQGELEKWREQSIIDLSMEFPTADYENWGRCRLLYPHVKFVHAISEPPKSRERLLDFASLLHKASWYAYADGMIDDMIDMSSMSRATRSKLLGAECDATMESGSILALAYMENGRLNEAKQLSKQVLESQKRLRIKNQTTIQNMSGLASMHYTQGRMDDARDLFIMVLETCQVVFGDDYPDTLMSMHDLGTFYCSQELLEEAEPLEKRVLGVWSTELGKSHPSTLHSMRTLASIYKKAGRLKESVELEEQFSETRSKTLGEDHPETLASMSTLTLTYDMQEMDELEISP